MTFRLGSGPCTWHTFDDQYRSRQGANKVLRRMVALGLAEVIGEVNFKGEGGNCFVYAATGGPTWKRNQLKHDVIAFRVIVRTGLPFLNGEDVDPHLRQDFVLLDETGTRRVNGEIDSGATPYPRLKKERLEDAYDRRTGAERAVPTLWVSCGLWSARDETRMRGLLDMAAGRPNHWFVTFHSALNDGLDAVVENCDGETKALSDLLTDPEPPSPGESP